MTAPYSPGYNPYSSNELDELERQRQLLSGQAPPPSALATDPMAGIGYDQTMAPEPVAAPAPTTAVQPFDLASAPAALRKGMGTSSVTTQGIPEAERQRLESAHAQLTGGRLNQIDAAGAAERDVASRGLGEANARGIESANQEVYKQRAIDDSQRKQAELRKAQDEWTAKKEDGSALNALGGNELAATLTSIGIAAGVFSQAMGWQNGNPVKDMLDKSIDRSVAAQREQKNSRLNVLAARLGDEKAAEAQVRGELHEATVLRIAAQKEGTQNLDSITRLDSLIQDQTLKAKEAQLAAHERTLPQESVTQTQIKTAGPKSLKQMLEDQEAGQQLRQGKVSSLVASGMSQEQAEEAANKYFPQLVQYQGQTAQQREKGAERQFTQAERGEKGADKLAEDMNAVESVRLAIDEAAKVANIEVRDGKYVQKPGTKIPGLDSSEYALGVAGSPLLHALHPFGVHSNTLGLDITADPAAAAAMDDPKTARMVSAAQNMIDTLGRLRSQGAVNDEESKGFEKMLIGSTPESFAGNMQQTKEYLDKQLEGMVSRSSPETRDAWRRRGGPPVVKKDEPDFPPTDPKTSAMVKGDIADAEERQKSGRRETEFERLERLYARMPK